MLIKTAWFLRVILMLLTDAISVTSLTITIFHDGQFDQELGLGRVYFFLPGSGFGPLFLARFGSGK